MAISLRYRDALPQVVVDELENLVTSIRAFLRIEHNEDGTHFTQSGSPNLVPVGGIVMWTADAPPDQWLVCNGDQVSRTDYNTLFQTIGTTYGPGNGTTTFNLPNLQQRFPLGKAASGTGSTLGDDGGAIDHSHTGGAHTHSISSDGAHDHGGSTGSESSHTHGVNIESQNGENWGSTSVAGVDTLTGSHVHDVVGNTGAGTAHAHSISSGGAHTHGGVTGSSSGTTGTENPPFLVVNYIIYTGV